MLQLPGQIAIVLRLVLFGILICSTDFDTMGNKTSALKREAKIYSCAALDARRHITAERSAKSLTGRAVTIEKFASLPRLTAKVGADVAFHNIVANGCFSCTT